MNFTIENGSLFKDIIMVLKDFSASVIFAFTKEGLLMQCMDSSHVSMSQLCFHSTFFQKYMYTSEESQIGVGISLEHLAKLCKLVGPKTSISWSYTCTDHLDVTMVDVQKDTRYNFKVRLMDIEDEGLEIPEMQYTHVLRMESSSFKKSIGETVDFGDNLFVQCKTGQLAFKVIGDAGEMLLEKKVDVVNDEQYSGNFNNKYLVLFSKADKVAPQIEVSMSEGMPIQMKYHIDDKSYFLMFVAPRINDDDDMDI